MALLSAARMKPGTTPLLTVMVDDEAIQDATVYVTIKMGDRFFVKSNYYNSSDVVLEPVYNTDSEQIGTQVSVQYSQSDTLCFRPGFAEIEVGWVFSDGTADKSNIGRVTIPKTLYGGVMLYGEHSS